MANLTPTAANVQPASNAVIVSGIAGATVTAGQLVYLLSSDNKLYLADADNIATAVIAGIALNGASDTQPLDYQIAGNIDLGATLTATAVYAASSTAGSIWLHSDLVSGDFASIVGAATATDDLKMGIIITNAAKA